MFFWSQFREFFFTFQKILLIVIISFIDFGNNDLRAINNAFLCFIICSIFFAAQIYDRPFSYEELNSLNFKANIIMLITIFFGIFSSICEDSTLQTLLMSIVVSINLIFFLVFGKTYLCIMYVNSKNSFLSKRFGFLLEKFFRKGYKYN